MPDKPDLFQKLFRKTKENLEKKTTPSKAENKPSKPAPPSNSEKGETKTKIPLTGGKLDAYRTCPKRFQYQYLAKRTTPPEPSTHLSFDSTLHAVLRDFYRQRNANEHFKLEKLLALLEKNWNNRGYENPEEEREWKVAAENGLRIYFQKFCQTPPHAIEIDYFFKVDLFSCEYSGRMDRVDKLPDGTLEIIDYKSGKPPAGGAVEMSENLTVQLLFLVGDVIWPKLVQKITHVFIRDGTVLTVQRNVGAMAQAKKTYLDIGENIYQGRFAPVRSQHCAFCEFQDPCPVGQIPFLNPSKLRAFLDCPSRFAHMYVYRSSKKRFEEPSFDLIFDRVIHNSLTSLYKDFKRNVNSDPMGFLMAAFYKEIPKDIPEELADLIKTSGRETLNSFFLKFYGNTPAKFVNHPVNVMTEQFEYQATFDRIDGTPDGMLHLIDFKTGKRTLDGTDIRLDPITAAACFAASRQWPGKIATFTNLYLRAGEAVTIQVDEFLLNRGREILEETARKIREKRFEAIAGFSCDRCSEKTQCQSDALMVSASKMQTMRDCPKKFKYQYIEKLAPPDTEKPYLALSQALHDALRNLLSRTQLLPLIEFLEDFRKRIQKLNPAIGPETIQKGELTLTRFYKELGDRPPKVKALGERSKATYDGMVLNATFDRVDVLPNGNLEIIDYKTSKKTPTVNESERDISPILTYTVADAIWPQKIERVTFHYLLTGDKLHFTPTEPAVQKLKMALGEFTDEMEKGTFEGHRNPLCPYCDYVGQCEDAKRLLLSPSKISSFLSCGLKYRMNYIDRVPKDPRPTPHLNFDRSIHYALKEFHQQFDKSQLGKNPMRYLLNKHWINTGFADWEDEQRFKARAVNFLEEYFKTLTGNEKVFALETSATWNYGNVDLTVQIDRVDELPDGKFEIIDYKTGKKIPDERVIHEDLTLMNMYLAGNQRWPGRVTKVSYQFLSAGKKFSLSPTEEQIEEHKKKISKIVTNIESGEFPSNRGALCAWCDFYGPCPEWKVKPFQLSGETPEVFRKRIRLSYSKMGLFENCPRAYRKLYIDRVPPKPQPFFSFGQTIHETFEHVYDPEHPMEKPSLEKVLQIYEEVWKGHREGFKDEATENRYKQDGARQINMYYKRFIEHEPFQPAHSIEDYFEIPIGKLAVMTGFIDRIDHLPDGTFEILDYKTEPTDRSQDEVDHDKQLSIYYWACETTMDMKISKLSLYMLDHDKKISTTRTEADVEKVVEHVEKVAARMIHEAEFAPKKNKYCKSCDHLHDCPLKEEIMKDQSLISMKKF